LKIPWKFELCLMVYIKHGTGIAATPKAWLHLKLRQPDANFTQELGELSIFMWATNCEVSSWIPKVQYCANPSSIRQSFQSFPHDIVNERVEIP
jgi:hypothetical protein